MRAMKDSGVEWIGEIPQDWEVVTLKKCCELCKGLPITKADLIENGSPVISYGQIHSKINKWSRISEALIRYVDDSYKFSNPLAIAQEGNIIFADTSEDYEGIGNCIYVDLPQGIFAGYHTIIVKPFDFEHPKYLAFLFQTDCWRSQLRSIASGIKVFSVTQKMLKNTTLLIPTVDVQRRIATYLDTKCSKIDAIIEKQQAVIEKLKEYKLSVITEAVTKGLNPDVEMKDSGVEWIGEVPNNWNVVRGKGLFREVNELSEDGTEELLTVSQYTGITPRSYKNVYMFEAESLEGYKICRIGDVAANTMWLWAGAVGVSNYDGIISPSYNVYRQLDKFYNSYYLDFLLRVKPLVEYYKSLSTGIRASRLRLYPQQFLNIMFPVPPIEEQDEIARFLCQKFLKIDKNINSKMQIIKKLIEYKKSLIYEVVTGKKCK